MKTLARHRAMEDSCRRHAEFDKTTASHWLEEAELWSKLETVEQRLDLLRRVRRTRAASSAKKDG
jgi:hypothetical protein